MKKITLLLFPLILITLSLFAQIRLDVEGDAWIRNRLIIGNSTDENLFIGINAGINTTVGSPNLYSGTNNTFIGLDAGRNNTEGSINTFVGRLAGRYNTNGSANTFIGSGAGFFNTTGNRNTFMGFAAGESNIIGVENTFMGYETGRLGTIGIENTFIGAKAGRSNTTGFRNTFIGRHAGLYNSTGQENTFVGQTSGESNTIGGANTFIGLAAGDRNTTGGGNLFLGAATGTVNTIGTFNTCLGTSANVLANNLINATAVGYLARVDVDNKVVIGNTSVTKIGGYANWMNLSDKRYKKKIQEESTKNHLDFILNLTPVSYQYNTVKLVKEQQEQIKYLTKTSNTPEEKNAKKETHLQKTTQAAIKAAQEKDKILYTGFLAQEVEKAANETGYEKFSGIVKPDDNGGKYALRYAEFVVPLVGAVQEQQQLIDAHQEQITTRDQRIEKLEADVAELKELLQKSIASKVENNQQTSILEAAKLGQNIPNPFTSLTKIPYYIPQNSKQAVVQVYAITGQLVKTIEVRSFGEGTLELQTNGLSNGQYTYNLEVDGRVIETKKNEFGEIRKN